MKMTGGTWLTLMAMAAVPLAGCAMDGQEPAQWTWKSPIIRSSETETGPIEPNIVRVNKFFSQTPWLSFANDGSRRVDGVTFSIYLEGPTSSKGVFGTGTISVLMFRLTGDEQGRQVATKLYEWEFDAQAAYPFRSKKQTALGWGYGMRLRWGEELDVEGDQVAFVIKYTREDGRVVSSSRQVMKIPGPEGSSQIVKRSGGVATEPVRGGRVQPVIREAGASAAPPPTVVSQEPQAQPQTPPRTRPKPRVTITVQPKPERAKPRYAGPQDDGD